MIRAYDKFDTMWTSRRLQKFFAEISTLSALKELQIRFGDSGSPELFQSAVEKYGVALPSIETLHLDPGAEFARLPAAFPNVKYLAMTIDSKAMGSLRLWSQNAKVRHFELKIRETQTLLKCEILL